jgi:hypothetical protein
MTEQIPVTLDYDFTDQGFYFIGRPVTTGSNDMLTILDNVNAGDPVFSTDRQNSWVENDISDRLVYNSGNSNWEPQPYNWEIEEGYQVYFEDIYQFSIEGNLLKPELNTIELPAAGIYYLPYYPFDVNDPDEAIDAFAGIFNQLDWVMDSEGNRLHNDNGSWIDNIGIMDPTQGYKVKMNAPATLTYPVAKKKKSHNKGIRLEPIHFIFVGGNAAQWTYTIYIDTEDFEIGDEIAAFSNDVMVGAMVIDSDDPWENDLNLFNVAIDGGYDINSPIVLLGWDASTGNDYEIEFEMIPVNEGAYIGVNYPTGLDHYSYAEVTRGGTVNVDDINSKANCIIYPNPTNDLLNIKAEFEITEAKIFTATGSLKEVLKVDNKQKTIDVSCYTSGLYIVQLQTDHGVIVNRFVVK